MDTQFTDFTVPNPNTLYYYIPSNKTRGFTLLMKLTLMVRNYPEAFDMIRQIVKDNPEEIDKQTRNGMNVLMIAAVNCSRYSLLDCIDFYINNCIDKAKLLNSTSRDGKTALIFACGEYDDLYMSNFSYECIELLLKSGANPNLCIGNTEDALSTICYNTDHDEYIKCIKLLLAYGAHDDSKQYPLLINVLENDDPGESILHDACKLLIESGFTNHNHYSPNDKYVRTSSIFKLCRNTHNEYSLKILELFINSGADPNILEHTNYDNALIVAMQWLHNDTPIDFIESLIKLTDNLDLQNEHNNTALITLCKSTRIWTTDHNISTRHMRKLLKKEPDVNKIKHQCRFHGNIPTTSKYVHLLLKAGVDVDSYDDELNTALMYYCKLTFFTPDEVETLILFIKKSNNITFKNNKGKTAYDYFIKNLQHNVIANDYIEDLLKGNILVHTNTKSARY